MFRTQLERACKEKRPLEIIYMKKDQSISQRIILVHTINDTFLNGFCLTKKQPRIFRVDSILAVSFYNKNKKLHA
ncbi:WYL domain-containing protein [Bacillus sp. B1-b2]|uniref:WYL domain-containing protein n=1 Tax=Bacillus sp. B1-b2 TaxID=2653201 RepID=UPI00126194F9|nr:WYL domain-containing protein [Bacillus sp. B1-b2]KAB7664307.1 WYL domain-containing protein [Bacillus sp. B1-b2]